MATIVPDPISKQEALAILKACTFYISDIDEGTVHYYADHDQGSVLLWFELDNINVSEFSAAGELTFGDVMEIENEHHCCGFSIAFEDAENEDDETEVYEDALSTFIQELQSEGVSVLE